MDINACLWDADVDSDDSVIVKISESIELDGLILKMIGSERQSILECAVTEREMHFQVTTEKPLYVELYYHGSRHCLKYVNHSGEKFYHN
jgi:hypothetical protein